MATITIDAKGKILGRLASQIATTLRGKHLPTYRQDRMPDITVSVLNVDQFKVTGKKMKQKMYYHFSGYPGGLKSRTLEEKLEVSPSEVLMLAIKRMLPTNRSRARLLKRVVFEKK